MATCAWLAHQRKVIKAYIKAIISQPPAHNEWCTSSYSLPLYTLLSFLASAEREKRRGRGEGEGEERERRGRGEERRLGVKRTCQTKQNKNSMPHPHYLYSQHYITPKNIKKKKTDTEGEKIDTVTAYFGNNNNFNF